MPTPPRTLDKRSVLNPSEAFELVSRSVELLNLRLHALPSPAVHVPHYRRVLLLDHLPSASIVDNEEAALMSSIDEMAIEEHIGSCRLLPGTARSLAVTSSLHWSKG